MLPSYLCTALSSIIHAERPILPTGRRRGNHFIILELGRRVLDKTREEATLEELTSEMAGGRELAELSHELQR